MLGLGIPFYAFSVALLLFGAIVVARFALGLAKDAKTLASRSRDASQALNSALQDVSAEAGRTARTFDRIEQTRTARRIRRDRPPV